MLVEHMYARDAQRIHAWPGSSSACRGGGGEARGPYRFDHAIIMIAIGIAELIDRHAENIFQRASPSGHFIV